MYAIVRRNTYDVDKLAEAQGQLQEFNRRHARQPGFLGSLSVDIGDGRSIVVNLRSDEESAEAALPSMVPNARQFIEPLLAEPSELLGRGPAILTDFGSGHVADPR